METRACQIPLEESGRRDICPYKNSTNSITRKRKTERKYGNRELIPKIDHKMFSTKGPKERYSTKQNK
jgi:hypothetical protein